MVDKYKKELSVIFLDLSEEISLLSKFPLKEFEETPFKACIVSAIAKCYQFNLDVNQIKDNNYSFYLTSFLRGMCEDLISLKFMLKLTEKNREIVTTQYMFYLLSTSIKSQNDYFKQNRPFQPVVRIKNIDAVIENHEKKLKIVWEKLGHRKDKIFPSVEHMAIDSKLKSLYDFLYHATSRTVHFSPNVLLRTGWFNPKDEAPVIKFSVSNFEEYYSLFNSHYAAILFIEFVDAFKRYLNLDKKILLAVKKLKAAQDELYFFPEIITFEELNQKRPSNVDYKILEMASKMDEDERKEFIKALPEILKEVKKKPKP